MDIWKVFLGVIVLVSAFSFYGNIKLPVDVVNTTAFDTTYPVNGSWNDTGQFFGDATEDGSVLTLAGTSTSGSYLTDERMQGQGNDVLFLTFSADAENLDSSDATATLNIRGLDEGVIVAQKTYELQNGENLIDNRAFRNATLDSYEFEIDMTSGSNQDRIPRVNNITISGETRPDESFLSTTIFILGMGAGLILIFSGLLS